MILRINNIAHVQCTCYSKNVFKKPITFRFTTRDFFFQLQQNWHYLVGHIGMNCNLRSGVVGVPEPLLHSIFVCGVPEQHVHSISQSSGTVFWIIQNSKWSSPQTMQFLDQDGVQMRREQIRERRDYASVVNISRVHVHTVNLHVDIPLVKISYEAWFHCFLISFLKYHYFTFLQVNFHQPFTAPILEFV